MLFGQIPIDPKAWAIVGPVVLGVIALLIALTASAIALKKAGLIGSGAIPSTNGNGNGKAFEEKIESLRRESNFRFNEHERRIAKHQEELRKEIDIVSERLSAQHDRIFKLEK